MSFILTTTRNNSSDLELEIFIEDIFGLLKMQNTGIVTRCQLLSQIYTIKYTFIWFTKVIDFEIYNKIIGFFNSLEKYISEYRNDIIDEPGNELRINLSLFLNNFKEYKFSEV